MIARMAQDDPLQSVRGFIFNANQVDNIIVTENGLPIGMLDIQDMVKLDLMN